jgi:hypothetical protein
MQIRAIRLLNVIIRIYNNSSDESTWRVYFRRTVYIITIMVIFLDSNKMMAMVRAKKEEKDLCVQDIKTFETLREEIKARKPKSWFTVN